MTFSASNTSVGSASLTSSPEFNGSLTQMPQLPVHNSSTNFQTQIHDWQEEVHYAIKPSISCDQYDALVKRCKAVWRWQECAELKMTRCDWELSDKSNWPPLQQLHHHSLHHCHHRRHRHLPGSHRLNCCHRDHPVASAVKVVMQNKKTPCMHCMVSPTAGDCTLSFSYQNNMA